MTIPQSRLQISEILIFLALPIIVFGQNYDQSFIQYSRDVEQLQVLETESKLSWAREDNSDTLHWIKEGLNIDEMPRMLGCEKIKADDVEKKKCAEEKMLHYIYSKLVYPVEALENRVEGRVIVSFYVNPDGKMSNAIVHRDLGSYTAGAALDVLDIMNKENTWKPGKSNGIEVPTLYTLPILFRLGPDNPIQHPKMYSKYYDTNNDWELIYDREGESTLNESTQVRLLISDKGKVINARVTDSLSNEAKIRAKEILLDLLDHSKWRPGSIYDFENTMEYVFNLNM